MDELEVRIRAKINGEGEDEVLVEEVKKEKK